jgi:phosphoribosyl-ATP pyrophosphohydrolase
MENVLNDLYKVILDRQVNPQEGSYTCYLFDKGIDKILKKVGEECSETIIAAKNGKKEETVYEISDLIYHLLVMMANEGIPLDDVMAELDSRAKKIGNLKKMRVTDKNT